jgi:hypothetical protein
VYSLRNIMRTPLLATVLGLSLAGCLTIGDSGSGSPGDDDTGSGGGGVGGGGGSGLGGGSGMGSNAGPNVNVTMDRMTVATELGKSEVVTLNLSSTGSFTGDVTVAPALVDGAGAALTAGGLTVTGPASITLAANGTTTAMYTVKIPTNATATQMLANLKLDVSSSLGSKSFTSAFTIAPNLTLDYGQGLGANVPMHPLTGKAFTVKRGAKLVFHNSDTAAHRTHGPGNLHEPAGGGQAGGTYVMDTTTFPDTTTQPEQVGCHTHDTPTYAKVTVE